MPIKGRRRKAMVATQGSLPLHPAHLADLRKSGLSDETIGEARIYSVTPRDINKKLGFNDPRIESIMAFPYPGCDGFERFKLFPPLDKKKYWQQKKTPNRLYIPEKVEGILQDFSVSLCLTEGEKKTLRAVQEGLPCIGLSGLWNWKNKGEEKLISDFDRINFKGRTVFIVPDNDWLLPNKHGYEKNLRHAVNGLAYLLIDRAARVFIVKLPDELGGVIL
jgi:hypothetical protein